MATEIDRLKEAIAKEANEIFEALDSLLLDLEKSPSSLEILNTIFRRVHTLKGSWGLYGHKPLERFTHAQEDLLDYLRSGELTVTTDIIDLLLECLDYTKLSYERVEAGEHVDFSDFAVLESKIKGFLPVTEEAGAESGADGPAVKDCGVDADFIVNKALTVKGKVKASVEIGLRLYQICIDFDRECMKTGVDPMRFFKGLGADGELLAANVIWDEVPKLPDLDPAHLYFGKACALYASKLGVKEVGALFDVAAGMGEVSFHQFTPAELTEHFGIEADPFWTEENGAASVEDEVKRKTINAFRTEIEKGVQAVRDHLILFANEPSDRESLEKVYRFFHNICDTSSVLGLRDLESISSPLCMIMENVYVEGAALKMEDVGRLDAALDEIKGVLTSHVDKAITEFIDSRRKGADIRSFALAEALLDVGVVTREILEQTVSATTLVTAGGGVRVMERRQDTRGAAALRIDPVRLDNLVDMVGELVIAQSQVSQDLSIMGVSDTRLDRNIAQLTRITSGIQDMVMGMRMLPLEQTFKKLSRVARDVSKELGKEIEFTIFGEETEVDKTIIDEIGDPLMHLIRNCVDHGIEKPADRAAAWKDAKGKVELNAFHRGGNVVIEVKDDGKGISRERVAKKAIEKGLITTDAGLSDQQVISLIFEPGFSTAEEITSISGRGVGLDAVKRGVENLRGKVEVSTEFGKGSTFTIKLPLTLAIIEGMLVRVGEERYIIPTLSIETSFRPAVNEITNVDSKGEVVKVRDAFHTLVKLHELYAIPGARKKPEEAILILVESEGRRCCIMVDDIIGNQHVVIKSLGDMLKGVKGVSGCTILGDGRVGLILDISGLMDITIG